MPEKIIRPARGADDLLTRKINEAIQLVGEAEEIAKPACLRALYDDLLEAHSALVHAKGLRRSDGSK